MGDGFIRTPKDYSKFQNGNWETNKLTTTIWAWEVKKRANFQCEQCGKTHILLSHHKDGKTFWQKKDGDYLSNGICLCSNCHALTRSNSKKRLLSEKDSCTP